MIYKAQFYMHPLMFPPFLAAIEENVEQLG